MSKIEIVGAREAVGFVVYGIRDKATGGFGYVGQTGDLPRRIKSHVRTAFRGSRTRRVIRWMHRILTIGGTLEFVLLEQCKDEAASLVAESQWVRKLASANHALTNRWLIHQTIIKSAQTS